MEASYEEDIRGGLWNDLAKWIKEDRLVEKEKVGLDIPEDTFQHTLPWENKI